MNMLNLLPGKNNKIPNYFKVNQMIYGIIAFDPKLCNGCGICVSLCPARGLTLAKRSEDSKKKIPQMIQPAPGISLCMACGDCRAACPKEAISIKQGFDTKFFFRKLSQKPDLTGPKKY